MFACHQLCRHPAAMTAGSKLFKLLRSDAPNQKYHLRDNFKSFGYRDLIAVLQRLPE